MQQVSRHQFHLFGQQRSAIHLDQPQHTLRNMQLLSTLLERFALIQALRIRLEAGPRVRQRYRHLLSNDVQGLRIDIGHVECGGHLRNLSRRQKPTPLSLRRLPVASTLAFAASIGSCNTGRRVEVVPVEVPDAAAALP